MNVLEFFGIIFLVILFVNIVIGIWAIKSAESSDGKIKRLLNKQES